LLRYNLNIASGYPFMLNSTITTTSTVGTKIKVLTVNIHKGFTSFNRRFMLHELREAVRHVHADVVFLQEVLGTHARHAERLADYPEAPHYEFLADAIWPQFAYGKNAAYPHGHHGNAVLSKFPIVHQENRDVSITGPERRGVLHCVLEIPNRKEHVHTFCVHLGLRESHRREQLGLLSLMIAKEVPPTAPVIVAGDFNDWRRRAHDILEEKAGLREVFVHANGHSAKTFPAKFPMLSLDRIYVRNANAHSPLILPGEPWNRLSDHAPLAAVIEV
jgi:endonuclease/exonuclease/phosphatase family metal-dependent hydrolase